MANKVAFITGGASGMGLAVANALSERGNWTLYLVDLNAEAGKKATGSLPNTHFHQANVTSYSSLSSAFENVFNASGRIDFVYANAGIIERDNFYTKHDLSKVPPEPNQLSIDINFKSVVNTSYLSLHYFRKSKVANPADFEPVLIMTASCGALYPSEFCPMYSGAKAAAVQFMRSIKYSYYLDGIRTYATCPGTIETGLLSTEEWKSFPKQYFTPMSTLVKAVLVLLDGGDVEDATGKKVAKESNWGLACEVSGNNYYFRDQTPFCDPNMEAMMKFTSMKNQLARIEKGKGSNGE